MADFLSRAWRRRARCSRALQRGDGAGTVPDWGWEEQSKEALGWMGRLWAGEKRAWGHEAGGRGVTVCRSEHAGLTGGVRSRSLLGTAEPRELCGLAAGSPALGLSPLAQRGHRASWISSSSSFPVSPPSPLRGPGVASHRAGMRSAPLRAVGAGLQPCVGTNLGAGAPRPLPTLTRMRRDNSQLSATAPKTTPQTFP